MSATILLLTIAVECGLEFMRRSQNGITPTAQFKTSAHPVIARATRKASMKTRRIAVSGN